MNKSKTFKVAQGNEILPCVISHNSEIVVCGCGWKGHETELKTKKVTIIANCPEDIEVCPKCESEWLTFY